MKVIQFLAILIFLTGFGYISYHLLMDFSDITPEQKEEVIRNACATNELQGDECLKYIESQLYWLNRTITKKTMKALQFLIIILFIYGFSHFLYRLFLSYDGETVTPEAKEELMKDACDNNKLSNIDCLNYEGTDYEERYK